MWTSSNIITAFDPQTITWQDIGIANPGGGQFMIMYNHSSSAYYSYYQIMQYNGNFSMEIASSSVNHTFRNAAINSSGFVFHDATQYNADGSVLAVNNHLVIPVYIIRIL